MANCEVCGKKIGIMSGSINGKCIDCANSSMSSRGVARLSEIEAVMLTTEAYPQGLKISTL